MATERRRCHVKPRQIICVMYMLYLHKVLYYNSVFDKDGETSLHRCMLFPPLFRYQESRVLHIKSLKNCLDKTFGPMNFCTLQQKEFFLAPMKKSLMHLTCCYISYFALRHTMPYVLSVASVTLASDPPGRKCRRSCSILRGAQQLFEITFLGRSVWWTLQTAYR